MKTLSAKPVRTGDGYKFVLGFSERCQQAWVWSKLQDTKMYYTKHSKSSKGHNHSFSHAF